MHFGGSTLYGLLSPFQWIISICQLVPFVMGRYTKTLHWMGTNVACPIRADGTLHSVPSALLYIYFVWQYLHVRTIEKTIYVVFKNVHNYLWMRYISCEGWNLSIIVQLTDENIEKGRNSKKFGALLRSDRGRFDPTRWMHNVNTFL